MEWDAFFKSIEEEGKEAETKRLKQLEQAIREEREKLQAEIRKLACGWCKKFDWGEMYEENKKALEAKGYKFKKRFCMNPSTHDDDLFCGWEITIN